jgi:hypothetical protein
MAIITLQYFTKIFVIVINDQQLVWIVFRFVIFLNKFVTCNLHDEMQRIRKLLTKFLQQTKVSLRTCCCHMSTDRFG